MSDVLNRPNRQLRRQKRMPPEQLNQWKALVFLHKGWKSKIPEQNNLRDEMNTACDQVEQTVLKGNKDDPNRFAAINEENLDPGKEFKAVLTALSYFEKAQDSTRPGLAKTLRSAAQAYLDHYNKDHSKRQKKQRRNLRKKEICESILSDLRKFELRDQLKEFGDPPWDSATQTQAAALKTTLDIETVPPGQGTEKLGGLHTFPAFWINKPGNNQNTQKSFLFKPTTSEQTNGFEAGGDTAREAMTSRMGDLLNGMTGVDFGVPPTNLVTIGQDKLPDGPLGDGVAPPDQDGKVTGSVQQYASSAGDLRDQTLRDNEDIAPESCQKIVMLDMLTLNCDRHAGNILIKPNQNGAPDLVPIDHGLSFPPDDDLALEELPRKLGDRHNAMLGLPSAHEPFTDDMIEAIEKLDPDAIAAGLKIERETIENAHPSTKGKLSDASIEMSRRSAMFLKLAVAHDPPLTPAAAQMAFAQNAQTLLDANLDDADFATAAEAVIERMAENQDAVADYFLQPNDVQEEMQQKLADNGWPSASGVIDRKWLLANLKLALQLARADTKNPLMMGELRDLIGDQELNRRLQTTSLRVLHENKNTLAPRGPMTGTENSDIDALEHAFPKQTKINRNLPALLQDTATEWRQFEELGGMNALDGAIEMIGLNGVKEKNAREIFREAIRTVRQAAGLLEGAKQSGRQDTNVPAVTAELAYVQRVVNELPGNHPLHNAVAQFANRRIDGSSQQKQDLRALRLQVIDAVRAAVIPPVKEVIKAIETAIEDADENTDMLTLEMDLQRTREALVDYGSGNVIGAVQRVAGWKQTYP